MSSADNKKIKEFKIVLIGESCVGKTQILTRYIYNTFSLNHPCTVSATYVTKKAVTKNGKEIKLQLWDTAGQERYRGITKLFYKNAAGIIIVYDITRRDSFDEIKKFWYKQVKENASSKAKIAIVGNKFDLYEKEKVKKEEGKAYAESIGAFFQLTSALDSYGVEDLFTSIVNSLEDSNYYLGNNEGSVKLSKRKKSINDNRRCC